MVFKIKELIISWRPGMQEKLNNKQSDKEEKINEIVDAINKDQIEKIIIKSNKLKSKLLKLIWIDIRLLIFVNINKAMIKQQPHQF